MSKSGSSLPGSETQFSTPITSKHSILNRNTASHSSSSARKSNPSLTLSSRSLMHSGHSVTKSIPKIPEKSSPINLGKNEFRRVTITPQRMDNAFSAVEYDNKLKVLTDRKRVKPPSPQEKLEALSAMANMFDDDGDDQHSTLPPKTEDPTSLLIQQIKSKEHLIPIESQRMNHYEHMFSDSSILEDPDQVTTIETITEQNIINNPLIVENDNPWISLLNRTVSGQNFSSIPPPRIPSQYGATSVNNASVTNFSSLISSLSSNHQQGIVSTPSLQPQSRIKDREQPSVPSTTTPYKTPFATPLPPQLIPIQQNMQSPSFPNQTPSKSITLNLADMSIPSWSPSKPTAELDPSLQPYLNFLRELNEEFFPTRNNSTIHGGYDDILRLWQRHMMLPVDQLQEQVFQQHEALVRLKVFDQLRCDEEVNSA